MGPICWVSVCNAGASARLAAKGCMQPCMMLRSSPLSHALLPRGAPC